MRIASEVLSYSHFPILSEYIKNLKATFSGLKNKRRKFHRRMRREFFFSK